MSITRTLVKAISNYNRQDSLGSKLRIRRIGPLLEMIEAVYKEHRRVKIIDIGGTQTYWDIIPGEFLNKHNVSITIINLPENLTPSDHGHFKFIAADGCNLTNFDDGAFHIAHSNSVIEHVGDWERMVSFAQELLRIAPNHFVQTPNFWFLVEPHFLTPFFYWFPKPFRIWLVSHFELGHWKKAATIDEAVRMVESIHLLNRKMFQELFKDSKILTERVFGLPKSFIAVKK